MKILIIDDEFDLNDPLFSKIKNVIGYVGAMLISCKTWEQDGWGDKAKDILAEDERREIVGVLLDMFFPGQRKEGGQIFDELQRMRGKEFPIIILTGHGEMSYDDVQSLFDRGATSFITKKRFQEEPEKLISVLRQIVRDPANTSYTLVLRILENRIGMINITDNVGQSLLEKKVDDPVFTVLLECARSPDRRAYFPRLQNTFGAAWDRTNIHKEVYKFNKSIEQTSDGQVLPPLVGLGVYGLTAFELRIGKVRVIEEVT